MATDPLMAAMLDAAADDDRDQLDDLEELAYDQADQPGHGALGTDQGAKERVAGYLREHLRAKLTGQQAKPTLESEEWMREAANGRQPGDRWQGPSGRWFTMRQDGRVVPARANADQPAQGQGRERSSSRANTEQTRRRTMELLRQAASNPASLSAEQLATVSEGLPLLTVDQLREMRRHLGARFGSGARKDAMVNALRQHVRSAVQTAQPVPDPDTIDLDTLEPVPEPPPAPPAPAAPQRQTDTTPQGIARDLAAGEFLGRADLESALARLPLQQQQQVRELAGLPYSPERARITDPAEYARALSQAIWDARNRRPERSPTGGRNAPSAEQPRPAPPPPPAPREQVPVRIPGIDGRAQDAPQLPSEGGVRFRWHDSEAQSAASHTFGRPVTPELLAACANGFDGAQVSVSAMGRNVVQIESRADGLYASRTFTRHSNGEVEVHNNYFRTEQGSAYDGHGIAMFLNQVRSLRAAGVDDSTTHAAGNFQSANEGGFNGYVTWPKFGYDGTMPRSTLASLPPEIKQKLGGKTNVQALLAIPGGEEAWELYGADIFDGRFDLADDSASMKQLNSYLEKRRGRESSGGGGSTRQARAAQGGTRQERMARRRAELEAKIRDKIATLR